MGRRLRAWSTMWETVEVHPRSPQIVFMRPAGVNPAFGAPIPPPGHAEQLGTPVPSWVTEAGSGVPG
jgi:hypothetical protein